MPVSPSPFKVRAALVKFEERLWSVVRAFLPLSRGNPGQLIDALQVIELQDAVDSALVAAGQGARVGVVGREVGGGGVWCSARQIMRKTGECTCALAAPTGHAPRRLTDPRPPTGRCAQWGTP